jgi:2,3-bisphosphoglycerate-independent phosphoglycerate mutase
MSDTTRTPLLLVILDGWGYREDSRDNAIAQAHTPVWDKLWQEAPHTLISGSGPDVGLPEGQMGNSEVGHMSLGAGRVMYQSITRIDQAIADGTFSTNPAYTQAIESAVATNGAVHVMGLLSPGGVHSHERHLRAIIELAHRKGANRVYLHAFLDGRDTPPRSALASLQAMENLFTELDCGRIATIVGRYYAMDRDNRWDRIEAAYRMLTEASTEFVATSATLALEQAYARDESDEFVQATIIRGQDEPEVRIVDGDCVLFMNFRADRARQLTRAFLDTEFNDFPRNTLPALGDFVMTTEYSAAIQTSCAYPPVVLANVLPEYLASLGKTQLRIAETEKYAHVTFFFSGGREETFEGEDRVLVPSPDVATYDLQPEMSAAEVTDKLVAAIESGRYDLIVCNYANGDMVGHTGNFAAAVKAVETLDHCLGRLQEALAECSGEALVTADHGNCEQMLDYKSGQQHTQHTTEHVPLVYIGHRHARLQQSGGVLADVAPTLLQLMNLPKPAEMSGIGLLKLT